MFLLEKLFIFITGLRQDWYDLLNNCCISVAVNWLDFLRILEKFVNTASIRMNSSLLTDMAIYLSHSYQNFLLGPYKEFLYSKYDFYT